MPRATPHPEDRLLTAAECAGRVHCAESDWWGIAKASPVLRAGKRCRGARTFWKASAVALYLDTLPTEPVAARAVSA